MPLIRTREFAQVDVRFGKLTDETLQSLIVQVATTAITNARIRPGQIDEIYLGQFNSGMMAFPSSLTLQVSDELVNVPAMRVENAGADVVGAALLWARGLRLGRNGVHPRGHRTVVRQRVRQPAPSEPLLVTVIIRFRTNSPWSGTLSCWTKVSRKARNTRNIREALRAGGYEGWAVVDRRP
jgi:hypothetical protein